MIYNIYRLKGNKKPAAWKLPLNNELVLRKDKDGNSYPKKIQYVPGSDSIWAEDHKGDVKPASIWLEDGMIRVPKDNIIKNEILQAHSRFGVDYELDDPKAKAKEELSLYHLRREAGDLIFAAEGDKLKAMGVGVFGAEALKWDIDKAELELNKLAYDNPKRLIEVTKNSDFTRQYVAALAFNNKLVKYNATKTAVVWNSQTEGHIVAVAKGQSGVLSLGDFLIRETEESQTVLQELGNQLKDLNRGTKKRKTA